MWLNISTFMKSFFYYSLSTALFVAALPTNAAFSDVPSDHYAASAITYLQENGYVQGYSDNTFKPNQAVNRAEAMKFIIAPLVSAEQLQQFTSSNYNDVPSDAWFLPYVEYGRQAGVIDGPESKPNFNGGNTVIKAEFLKMVLLGNKIDARSAYNEIQLPLSSDVTNVNEWFYPYMRYSIASSMTRISDQGTLNPGQKLTRGDTAVLLYRLLMYNQNKRNQALLSMAETEINVLLGSLEQNDIVQAEYASARALLSARGAHTKNPDQPVVLGALKITEAFRALVRGYRAGLTKNYDEVIRLAGDAWNLASRASELSSDDNIKQLSSQLQGIAKGMADEARALKGV